VDGVCCYNFQAAGVTAPPPGGSGNTGGGPTTLPNTASVRVGLPALLLVLLALITTIALLARPRRSQT
jgi:hypothetical protein